MRIPASFETELEEFLRCGVLEEIRTESLDPRLFQDSDHGTLNTWVCTCCDGHQFDTTYRMVHGLLENIKIKNGLQPNGNGGDCLHMKTMHGGPLILSERVPESIRVRHFRGVEDRTDYHLLANFGESQAIKGMGVALLVGHAICSKMKDVCPTLRDYLVHLALARMRLMETYDLSPAQVIPWMQIHRRDEREMYHLHCTRLLK